MPTYQYRCTACARDLDVVQSFSDAALTECPACSGRLRKVFGSVGVVFKGSGFYKTDSRSGSVAGAPAQRNKDTAADGAGKETAGKDAAKADGSASSTASTASSTSSSGASSASAAA